MPNQKAAHAVSHRDDRAQKIQYSLGICGSLKLEAALLERVYTYTYSILLKIHIKGNATHIRHYI